MNQTILFTPVGGTDPISLNNYHDGSILHICRFYKPDKVILYMSKEMLDFQEKDVLSWLAELMKHRDAADSKRYRMLAAKFIDKYGIATNAYDVIKGWRANASYFYIAKEFVRDNIDIDILEELLSLGGLGIQYCIKTEKAYANLREIESDLLQVEYNEFNNKYNQRDIEARKKMRNLVDSDANKVTNVFSTLF